ncbi:MAG: hypothetical protein ACYC9O_15910 [Candidatus Latescibacterota bacterium]
MKEKNKSERISGGKKAGKLLLLFLLMVFAAAPDISVQTWSSGSLEKQRLLPGVWHRRGFVYTFADSAAVQVRRTDVPGQTVYGRYSWFRMGEHDCIIFRKGNAGENALEVILIGEISDSTAVIALGTPFVRADSSRGLTGLWKHLDRFERMEWRFGSDNAEYRKTVVEPLTGQERVVEERAGALVKGEDSEPGNFTVSFRDGKRATVLPVIYRDMMYLFDLSPGKSYFVRERAAQPSPGDQTAGE